MRNQQNFVLRLGCVVILWWLVVWGLALYGGWHVIQWLLRVLAANGVKGL